MRYNKSRDCVIAALGLVGQNKPQAAMKALVQASKLKGFKTVIAELEVKATADYRLFASSLVKADDETLEDLMKDEVEEASDQVEVGDEEDGMAAEDMNDAGDIDPDDQGMGVEDMEEATATVKRVTARLQKVNKNAKILARMKRKAK